MTTLSSFPIETKTLAELTTATTIEDTDLIHLDQGGVDKHYTGALLKQEMTDYSTNGGKCVDSGVANAYIFSPLSGKQLVSSLQDGMRFYGTALNPNTGSSTIEVHGQSALIIVDNNGDNLTGGEITGDFEVEYDLANTRFILLQDEILKEYDSGDINIVSGGGVSLTHSLVAKPRIIQVFLKCSIAEEGYSVGDEVLFSGATQSAISLNKGLALSLPNSVSIDLRFGLNSNVFNLLNKTTGDGFEITNTNWRLIVRAYT